MAKAQAKVLLVDDSGVMRALLRSIMNADNFLVVGEAANGVKALEMIDTLQPDVVCLDIEMPELKEKAHRTDKRLTLRYRSPPTS